MKQYVVMIMMLHFSFLYASNVEEVILGGNRDSRELPVISEPELTILKNRESMFKLYNDKQKILFGLVKHLWNVGLYSLLATIVARDKNFWILSAFPVVWTFKEIWHTGKDAQKMWRADYLKQQILWQCFNTLSSEQINHLKHSTNIAPHLRVGADFLNKIENFRLQNNQS